MIVDSHCHLDYDPMVGQLDLILDRALKNGALNRVPFKTGPLIIVPVN